MEYNKALKEINKCLDKQAEDTLYYEEWNELNILHMDPEDELRSYIDERIAKINNNKVQSSRDKQIDYLKAKIEKVCDKLGDSYLCANLLDYIDFYAPKTKKAFK